MIGCWNKSVILTYLGLVFAVVGIFFAAFNVFSASIICLVLAGVCDLFDGTVARMTERTDNEKSFGVQLDSLVDVVSFIVLPITILFSQLNSWFIAVPVAVFYAICGVARLAWFNITTNEDNKGIYTGMPVTYVSFILPVVAALIKIFGLSNSSSIIFTVVMFFTALLFVVSFKNKRPNMMIIIIMLIIIAIAILILFV